MDSRRHTSLSGGTSDSSTSRWYVSLFFGAKLQYMSADDWLAQAVCPILLSPGPFPCLERFGRSLLADTGRRRFIKNGYMPTDGQDGNIDFIVGQAEFSYDMLRHFNPLFFAASVAWIICLLPGKDQLWSTTAGYSPIDCIPTFVDCSALPVLAVYTTIVGNKHLTKARTSLYVVWYDIVWVFRIMWQVLVSRPWWYWLNPCSRVITIVKVKNTCLRLMLIFARKIPWKLSLMNWLWDWGIQNQMTI